MRFNFFSKIILLLKKIFNKRVIQTFFCLCCISFLLFSPSFIFRKSNFEVDINKYFSSQTNQKTVLTLWHIETFEGGSNNRGKYLEKCAMKFNTSNEDCLVYVKTLNEEQLILNLKDNKKADIFSFGIGAGYLLTSFLDTLDKPTNVREELLTYSSIGNKIYAYPYILSGYCLISRNTSIEGSLVENLKEQKINNKKIAGVCFDGDSFINPARVLEENNVNNLLENKDVMLYSSTYNAYCEFLKGKSSSLLGTTRDLIRCKNREEKGVLETCSYKYFGEYTDLIQYIGVNSSITETKKNLAKNFSLYLTQTECQNELKNYGLFSCTSNKIYASGYFSEFEDVLAKLNNSINVFSNSEEINNFKQKSKDSIFYNKPK